MHSSKSIRASRFDESESTAQLYKPAPSPLILTHKLLLLVLLLRRPLPSPSVAFCNPHRFLLQLPFAIPIASTARTVLARAGLRNLFSLKVLYRIAVNQVFEERLDATTRSLNDYSWRRERLLRLHPGDQNDYFVYFLVIVRGIALRSSSCIDVVRLHQARPIE